MLPPDNILFVCATPLESTCLGLDGTTKIGFYPDILGTGKSLLITGVGQASTTYQLGKLFANHSFTLAVNFGVAGTLDLSIPLGSLVEVVSDEFADLGAEDGTSFLSLFEMNLLALNEFPYKEGRLVPLPVVERRWSLPKVHGATVNTVHGNMDSIAQFMKRTDAAVETMEGAAFFYACNMAGIHALQIRAISNVVEARNRDRWRMKEALDSLTSFLKKNYL